MISTWQLKKEAESYVGQLEQMLVKRIRTSDDPDLRPAERAAAEDLSDFSREINEELERIESLVKELGLASNYGSVTA